MNGQSCKTCRFAKARVRAVRIGRMESTHLCMRYPRQVATTDGDEQDLYPSMAADDWCGEYQPANPETVEQGAAVMARLVLMGDMAAARALADKLTGGD